MTLEQLTSPTALAIAVLLALALVRFGIWWVIIRTVLRPLLSPVGLVMAGAAVAVMTQLD